MEQQWHLKTLHFTNTHTMHKSQSRICPLGILQHEGETQSDVNLLYPLILLSTVSTAILQSSSVYRWVAPYNII